MEDECLGFLNNLPDLLFGKGLDILFLQIRIHIIQIPAHKNLLQQLYRRCGQQVCIEIACCQNDNDLQRHRNHFGHSNDIRLDIILLLGIHQTVLIRHKIGTHRIKQKNQIIQCQIPECYTLWLFHKIWQKGDNRKSDACDHKPYDPVCLLIQKHVGLDLLIVLMDHRLIQAVIQCCTNSQLCHGQYRQYTGI